MFRFDKKKIISAMIPFLILVSAWILAMGTLVSYKKMNVIFVTLPYIFAFFSLALSVWFQHSRAFYAVCILLFAMSVISSGGNLNHKALINGISFILPVVFILLAVTEERGIVSKHGLIKGLVIVALILFVVIDAGAANPWLDGLKPAEFIIKATTEMEGIPGFSVFLFFMCLCILLTRFMLLACPMDMAFTGVSLGCFILLYFTKYPDVLSIFFTAVFLIFIIALFEASYSLAFRDTLTGILSRRAMEQDVLRLGSKYAIAMVDIDHFKKVNDSYGHLIGDDVLKMVASVIEKNAHPGKAFRYGGEEFVIIFPKKEAGEIEEIMDRLRIAIEKRPLIIRGADRPKKKPKAQTNRRKGAGTIRVTVSVGIADKSERMHTAAEVIEAADKALYRAKKNGRNCVVVNNTYSSATK